MNPTTPLDSSRKEPIPLIIFQPRHLKSQIFHLLFTRFLEYIINDEVIAYVKSVPGPMGIVTVAGLYRTVKSCMLFSRSNDFGVGPMVNSETSLFS